MDEKRIKALAEMKFYPGDQETYLETSDSLKLFLDLVFSRRRIIILKVSGNKGAVKKELKSYCKEKNLEYLPLPEDKLKPDDIKGHIETMYTDSEPCWDRKKPDYITENNQMIIIDNINESIDIETLRAFMYMASLGSYSDDIKHLPKYKLPYGSAYVFLAEDKFPLKKFASISSYWRDESAAVDLRDFRTRVKEHLGEYKENKLYILEEGKFIYKGKEISKEEYKYILPEGKRRLNIIEKYRDDFFNSDYRKIKPHMYFHHLNSSQAMCINFFYPLIKENLLKLILDIMWLDGSIDYNTENVCFEKESNIETENYRKTNFDFYIKLKSGIKIYFEIKYTENGFGKAKFDEDHKKKFNEIYKPKLDNNPAIKNDFKTEEYFLNNYQIMRNIINISDDSYVVFIYPEENYEIRKSALNARNNLLENSFKEHLILFTWEDIVNQLISKLQSAELKDYYENEFTNKYLKY